MIDSLQRPISVTAVAVPIYEVAVAVAVAVPIYEVAVAVAGPIYEVAVAVAVAVPIYDVAVAVAAVFLASSAVVVVATAAGKHTGVFVSVCPPSLAVWPLCNIHTPLQSVPTLS